VPDSRPRAIYRAVVPQPIRRQIRDVLNRRARHVTLHLPIPPGEAGESRQVRITAPRYLLIPRMLAETGLAGYEPETLAVFLAAIDLAPAGSVLDIGANVGVYGLLARALSDRDVHAFEPVPELARVAIDTGVSNQLTYAVSRQAVGREPGEATFYLSDSSDSSNSLNPAFRASSRTLTVPVTTLDLYVDRQGLIPAVVKIDAETGEPDVLAGSRETLLAHRPWLLLEVLPGRTDEAVAAEMQQWGYTWYRCVGDPPYDAATDLDRRDGTAAPMWLMLPEPATAEFWDRALEWLAAIRATAQPVATRHRPPRPAPSAN
jgi:FkbM family methyltransferase